MNPSSETVRRTFAIEIVRSVTAGVQETAFMTFAILIALTQFESGPGAKSSILASQAIGLICSIFIVPWVRQREIRLRHAVAGMNLISAIGFFIAAFSNSEIGYLAGMSIGFFAMALPMPLQAQILRENYPDAQRGRLFGSGIFVRALSAMAFSYFGGAWLEKNPDGFATLLLWFAIAALVAALCFAALPGNLEKRKPTVRVSVFNSMHWLRDDSIFRTVIISAMFMGMGVLPIAALRVEYIANPIHGVNLDIAAVSFVSGVVPSIMRVASSFFWGWLFDQMNFIRLRIIINLVFLSGFITYYTTSIYWLIVLGSAIFGIARGGGEILWNLWVNKLAKPQHVAEYMSVHTFFTGLRALVAPFLGFYMALYLSVNAVVIFSSTMVLTAVATLWPLVRKFREREAA